MSRRRSCHRLWAGSGAGRVEALSDWSAAEAGCREVQGDATEAAGPSAARVARGTFDRSPVEPVGSEGRAGASERSAVPQLPGCRTGGKDSGPERALTAPRRAHEARSDGGASGRGEPAAAGAGLVPRRGNIVRADTDGTVRSGRDPTPGDGLHAAADEDSGIGPARAADLAASGECPRPHREAVAAANVRRTETLSRPRPESGRRRLPGAGLRPASGGRPLPTRDLISGGGIRRQPVKRSESLRKTASEGRHRTRSRAPADRHAIDRHAGA
jgi:hypothetical protein